MRHHPLGCRALPAARARRSFTLVEMLIVILIITILASIVLVGMTSVLEKGKRERTQAQIARLNALLTDRWESYLTRRVPVANQSTLAATALLRLSGVRELMRLELPDRKTDVVEGPVVPGIMQPSLSVAYNAMATAGWSVTHQGAECLYMIVSQIQDGPSTGLQFFRQNEIGDVDGDGMPEILDAWGNPIELLRWAPGFRSPLQDGVAANGADAFDPLQVDPRFDDGDATNDPFLLHPLIFSAGTDGLYEIATDTSPTALSYASISPANDPYHVPGSGSQLGAPVDTNSDSIDNSRDNIHNHLIEAN